MTKKVSKTYRIVFKNVFLLLPEIYLFPNWLYRYTRYIYRFQTKTKKKLVIKIHEFNINVKKKF